MRKSLLFIFAFLSFTLLSQNWNVFNKYYRYNYKFNNSQLVTNVMFVDTVNQSGTDTIYKMNKIGVECTGSCPTVTAALNPTVTYVVPNMPQFLQRKIRKYSSGIVMLLDTSKQVIIPTCSVTQTWLFDSILNINATCTSATVQNVFGQNDSVKTIIIGGTDSLILSKSFGVLKFPKPYNQNKYYRLVGIEKKDSYDQSALYGEKVPNAWDFYNFSVGDIFSDYECDVGWGSMYTSASRRKLTIENKSVTPSGITYTQSVFSKTLNVAQYNACYYLYAYPNYTLNIYSEIQTYSALSSPTLFCNAAYPNMLGQPNDWYFPVCNLVHLGKDNWGKQIKYMGHSCDQQFNIVLPNYNANISLTPTLGIFQTNTGALDVLTWAIGETYGVFQHHHLLFESTYDYCLGSLTRNGTTYFGNQDPIGLKENSPNSFDPFLSPNPASNKVTLPNIENSTIKVYNSIGQLVHSSQNENTIDVSQFPSGIYLVNIECPSFKMSKKLIVEH